VAEPRPATSLTHNEMRAYLRDGVMPENYVDRIKLDLEFLPCENCDNRRCMGCVVREWDHECASDCPFCCEVEEAWSHVE
jgi:hypothetical protein